MWGHVGAYKPKIFLSLGDDSKTSNYELLKNKSICDICTMYTHNPCDFSGTTQIVPHEKVFSSDVIGFFFSTKHSTTERRTWFKMFTACVREWVLWRLIITSPRNQPYVHRLRRNERVISNNSALIVTPFFRCSINTAPFIF